MTTEIAGGAATLARRIASEQGSPAGARATAPVGSAGAAREPRTVILVSDFAFINGGQAKVAIDSARLLAAAGLNVVFFAAVGPVDPHLAQDGIEVVHLGQHDILTDPNRTRAALRGAWNTHAQRTLSRLCSRFDPGQTILHCHGFAKALSPAIGPVLTRGPIAHVYTMHEYFLACPNGGFYNFQAKEICRKKALGISCLATNCDARHPAHKLWRVARQATMRTLGSLPGGLRDVIYISDIQRRAMLPYIAAGTRLHHVPNPLPVAGAPVNAAANEDFLFIGRLNPEKGCLLFAEAVGRAGAKGVVVGDGPEREKMRSLCPHLSFTGWLPPEDVQACIAKARCLVFPSLWYECQPLVPLEALARGVPVIAGAWSAASEAVQDGENGLIVDQPSPDAFASAIAALQKPDHPVFTRVRASSPPTASERDHLDRLMQVYAGILRRGEF